VSRHLDVRITIPLFDAGHRRKHRAPLDRPAMYGTSHNHTRQHTLARRCPPGRYGRTYQPDTASLTSEPLLYLSTTKMSNLDHGASPVHAHEGFEWGYFRSENPIHVALSHLRACPDGPAGGVAA